MITLHNVSDVAFGAIAASSVIYRFLPPAEKFNDWPRFQGWYKFFMVFFQWVAFNKSPNGGTNGSTKSISNLSGSIGSQ